MANKTQEKENIHKNHRERMRNKINEGHLNSFADHEILEVLLYNVIPRSDTNVVAHNLIKCFGNLKNVLSADSFQLISVDGVGAQTASYIVCMGELFKRTVKCESKIEKVDNPNKIKELVRNEFKFELNEKVIMICVDRNFKILQKVILCSGDSSMAKFSLTEAVKKALLLNAKYVVLAHNHINASVYPSVEDMDATRDLIKRFFNNNIILLDHVITNGKEEFNFRSSELFYEWYQEVNIDFNKLIAKINFDNTSVACNSDLKFLEYIYYNKNKN